MDTESKPTFNTTDTGHFYEEEEDSDEDSLINCEDLQVIYLDELPLQDPPPNRGIIADDFGDGNSDPDDPDDPDSEGGDSSASSEQSEESDGDEESTFTFNHPSLCANLHLAMNRTVKEALLLDLSISARYNLSYEALIAQFRAKNVLFGHKYLPSSKKELWRILNRRSVGLTKHGYCNSCKSYIGKYEGLPDVVICNCGFTVAKSKLKWFISLSLKKQLQRFLSYPGIAQCMRYREEREKRGPLNIEDILDGEGYRRMQGLEGILDTEWNYSYIFNTDGFSLSKSSNLSAWPIYVKLNELIPSLRQKYVFLVSVFVDNVEPNMTTVLRPFVRQANHLSSHGLTWRPDGVHEVNSKFFPTCLSCDAKARCALLSMTQYNGHFGCTFCTHIGVYEGNSMKYPSHPHQGVPQPVLRNDLFIRQDMVAAHEHDEWVNGVQGPSELMNLSHFDLADGNAIDDLHPFYSGVGAFLTELLLTRARPDGLGFDQLQAQIDQRLLRIKTPSVLSRKPRSITKRAKYKGSEWRTWVLYLCVPCLEGLLPRRYVTHLEMFCNAIFLLSQDVIQPDDMNRAERLLNSFVLRFEELYGVENMRYNVHQGTHVLRSVRNWGPLWGTSTFKFESWNFRLMKKVTSPTGAVEQIVIRYLIQLHILSLLHQDNEVSEVVRREVESIVSNKNERKNARLLARNVYGLGSPIVRRPTNEENILLQREGLMCHELNEFQSALINGVLYRSTQRPVLGKSDDTNIYTWDDTFCSITNIVSLTLNGDDVCGFFVNEYEVEVTFEEATHVAQIVRGRELPHFLRFNKVRCPAVKMSVNEASVYVVPLCNVMEID